MFDTTANGSTSGSHKTFDGFICGLILVIGNPPSIPNLYPLLMDVLPAMWPTPGNPMPVVFRGTWMWGWKLCWFWQGGTCTQGIQCRFAPVKRRWRALLVLAGSGLSAAITSEVQVKRPWTQNGIMSAWMTLTGDSSIDGEFFGELCPSVHPNFASKHSNAPNGFHRSCIITIFR